MNIFTFSAEGFFRVGTDELEVFRNGQKLIVDLDYEEISQTAIRMLITVVPGDEIEAQVKGRQLGGNPGSHSRQTELVGGTNIIFTVPTYTVGNDSLRVYRNGAMLSLANGDYIESGPTLVKIVTALNINDQLEFIVRGENLDGAPILFEEQAAVGGVNEVFTLTTGTYLVGTDTLEVYRNKKKLVVGEGYDEIATNQVRFNGTSIVADLFTFMVRAQGTVYPAIPPP